ncbi:hypothetical protein J4216_00360 [Candidatus Woesearchaeota archaeon]|nr:hypothetical protein [Candidatus Woesearchaeota archaeon]
MGDIYDRLTRLLEQEDPLLVSSSVISDLEDFRNIESDSDVINLARQNRRLERSERGLPIAYARNFLLGVYYSGLNDGEYSLSLAADCYRFASSSAFSLTRKCREENIVKWLYRSYQNSRRVCILEEESKSINPINLFYAHLFVLNSGLNLLDRLDGSLGDIFVGINDSQFLEFLRGHYELLCMLKPDDKRVLDNVYSVYKNVNRRFAR